MVNKAQKVLISGAVALQLMHFAIFIFKAPVSLASNVLQAFISLLAAVVCLHRAGEKRQTGPRHPWGLLSSALLIWAIAQIIFLFPMLSGKWKVPSSLSDVLWLLFAFPLLLTASKFSDTTQRDIATYLDLGQATIFFSSLFVLVYARPAIISLSIAYEVQSIALVLAFALRYSTTKEGSERIFYRDTLVFTGLYAIFSIVGYIAEDHGWSSSGTIIDVCWTIPFTVLSILASLQGLAQRRLESVSTRVGGSRDPIHLHGISAFGVASMSLGAAGVLALHQPIAGGAILVLAFLLFAARTSLREWQMHSFQARLEHSALHDPLTGLANRTLIQQELSRRLARLDRAEQIAVLFIDIDRFKAINDRLGHFFGDLVLKEIASQLRLSVRRQDQIGRYSGDEFVIILDKVTKREAETLARRVVTGLRKPISLAGRIVHVSASVGVAMGGPEQDSNTLIQDADFAMYEAKSLGKDRTQLLTPDILSSVKHKSELQADLHEALGDGSIKVYYQPIYDTATGEIVGFEALARWQHPEYGMVSPAEFIPLAEEMGLIVDLGLYVTREACAQCRTWNSQFRSRFFMSVNVSARQFSDPDFLSRILAILVDAELNPSLLKIEITESVLLSGCEGIDAILAEARALGISLSLDDFGTGYSSLSYLLSLPFDVVKIDQSFVRNLDCDSKRADMVRTIIELATRLKMKTVAEGVETPEELSRLREFQCSMVQGYFMSRPLDPEAISSMLANGSSLKRVPTGRTGPETFVGV